MTKISVAILLLLSVKFSSAQYQIDTSFQWNGVSYSIFKLTLDSFSLSQVSIVNNQKLVSEQLFFSNFNTKGDFFSISCSIVDAACNPLGLYIESGKAIKNLNLGSGSGNFYSLSNGVIAFSQKFVEIVNSRNYKQEIYHQWAIQTGPMLVDSSKINPQLNKESVNKQYRVGVGLIQSGGKQTLVFARSNQPVNFYHIASLFFEKYNTSTALCLQSGVSSIKMPGIPQQQDSNSPSCIYILIKI